MDGIHQLSHEIHSQSPDLTFGKVGFKIRLFDRGGVKRPSCIAHADDDLIPFHIACHIQRCIGYAFIGVFDDVGGGLIGGKLEGVDGSFGEPSLPGNFRDGIADLVQKIKPGWECVGWHKENDMPSPIREETAFQSPIGNLLLEASHSGDGVVEGFKEFGEACQFESFADALRNADEDHFAAIVAFAVALGGEQGAETGAGHVFQLAHIEGKFETSVIVGGFKRLCELGSGCAVNPSFYCDQVAVLEFLGGDFHNFSSEQGFE